jgi:DNA-binding beta-propeller fold protein YncE
MLQAHRTLSEDIPAAEKQESNKPVAAEKDRSPVDLILTKDEQWLLTANQTAGTVSLVEVATGKVQQEIVVGDKPSALVFTPDEQQVLVANAYSGEVVFLNWQGNKLQRRGAVKLRFEPRGLAVSPDSKLAYVALTTAHAVAVLDIASMRELDRIPVGKWPRTLALTPDGKRLAVGVSGEGGVSVVDTVARKMLFTEDFVGMNLGQMHISSDATYVYFPFILYRRNPISQRNIQLGWVLASRLGRVRLDKPERREALSLDPPGQAVADPHGLALSPDEKTLVMAASGTHELLIFHLPDLPLQALGGTDHLPEELRKDTQRFSRIDLGGRPMFLRYARDGRRVFVANYLLNAVQEVDLAQKKILRHIPLSAPTAPSLARKGEELFYDARRSLDQWYSCHSCHYDGHVNSQVMDTRNDGSSFSFKTVLTLRNVTHTGPWTWHGWQKDIQAAVSKSVTDTMLGRAPNPEEVTALIAYLETLRYPSNPHRLPDGSLTEAAQRGKQVFESEKAGCSRCHNGPYFTDNKIHIVGLESRQDVYRGFNTPSLIGVYDRTFYLHDGRSATLEDVLKGPHNPAKVTRKGELTTEERKDLIEYLKSL